MSHTKISLFKQTKIKILRSFKFKNSISGNNLTHFCVFKHHLLHKFVDFESYLHFYMSYLCVMFLE